MNHSLAHTDSYNHHTPQDKPEDVVIATFYHFTDFPDFESKREALLTFCHFQKLKGTILIASEGVNATVSGSREGIDALLAHLRADERFSTLIHKESVLDYQPFERMKVRLKKEIVGMGVAGVNSAAVTGHHVPPQEWDALITQPGMLLVDTRNDYEVEMGSFEGAINPHTNSFREFPAWCEANLDIHRDKKVAMFCTGGVRCEKASSYLVEQGFEVFQLDGGILNYFEKTKNASNKWHGDCFVFDERVAVTPDLKPSNATICPSCNTPFTSDEIKLGSCEYGVKCSQCLHDGK
ncbi:MAG: rhodanese-related sulfurtransferase [Alphaproteobacteria bacterium]|nr:rhodanese-related sulfurtransferase [Alphaproteobacteria bacterium]